MEHASHRVKELLGTPAPPALAFQPPPGPLHALAAEVFSGVSHGVTVVPAAGSRAGQISKLGRNLMVLAVLSALTNREIWDF